MLIQIIGHILAGCIGLSLGLIGGGGSVLAVPILVYVMGIAPKPAIAMTLVIVGTVSLVGLIPHWQHGNVNLKKAFMFGSATMLGSFLGAKIATLPFVTGAVQMLLFAFMMLLAAIFMIKKSGSSQGENELNSYIKPVCKYCWLWMLTEGLGIGVLTGLVGVGGGFAIVPALVLLGQTPIKEAIGTSLVIITMNSLAGFLGYFGQVELNWLLMLSFTFVASLGIIYGAYLSKFVSGNKLQKGFGYFLVAVSAFVLFQQRDSFRPRKDATSPPSQTFVSQQRIK
jgi:hypothetical protein